MSQEIRAKKVKLVKQGHAIGGAATYEITCGKCSHKFTAQIPLHPNYRKAACKACSTVNQV